MTAAADAQPMDDMPTLGWLGIIRLGLVQASIGAIVVLATSTINRVMVVEWGLPALLPGVLIAWHYLIQIMRPRFGHGSDVGGRRAPWILGGMAALSLGGIGASVATALIGHYFGVGIALAVVSYSLIGIGVGAAGTSLLALLAKRVEPTRRPAAATIVWLMMILGFALTAGIAGKFLDPFSPERLVGVVTSAALIVMMLTSLAIWRVEGSSASAPIPITADAAAPAVPVKFSTALADVWAEPAARRMTVFIFISMLAYSAQELVFEPFAGAVLSLSPGQSTQLTGLQHGGALVGMILVALFGARIGSMRGWIVGGCLASAAGLVLLSLAGLGAAGGIVTGAPIQAIVFALGLANGTFAVSAIGAMMRLAGTGRPGHEGMRMGLWGAAQAVAFAMGGVAGTGASDLARSLIGAPDMAYAAVFIAQAVLFVVAAVQALSLEARALPIERQRSDLNFAPSTLGGTSRE